MLGTSQDMGGSPSKKEEIVYEKQRQYYFGGDDSNSQSTAKMVAGAKKFAEEVDTDLTKNSPDSNNENSKLSYDEPSSSLLLEEEVSGDLESMMPVQRNSIRAD